MQFDYVGVFVRVQLHPDSKITGGCQIVCVSKSQGSVST